MKKGYIVLCFLLILCSSFVLSDSQEVYIHISGDTNQTSGSIAIDGAGVLNGTLNGNPTNVAGIIGEAYNLSNGDTINMTTMDLVGGGSLFFWFKGWDGSGGGGALASEWGGSSPNRWSLQVDHTSNLLGLSMYTDAWDYIVNPRVTNDDWVHVGLSYDGTKYQYWINGTNVFNNTIAVAGIAQDLVIGGNGGLATYIGLIDDVCFYNFVDNGTIANELWNGGVGASCGSGSGGGGGGNVSDSIPVNITLIGPVNDTQTTNTTVKFNYLPIFNNATPINCLFQLFNKTNNNSLIFQVADGPTNNTLSDYIYYSIPEGNFEWEINCTDSNGNNNISQNGRFDLLVDRTSPTITPDTISYNKTFAFDLLTGQINISDINLFSFQSYYDGVLYFNITDLNTTLYQYNYTFNVSNNATGVHNISVRICDGHTNNKLQDTWKIDNKLRGLEFDTRDKWFRINPENNDLTNYFDISKGNDRYSFTYNRGGLSKLINPNKNSYTFVVQSSERIYVKSENHDKYNAWLVIPDIGDNGRWVDFNLDIPGVKYKVKQKDDFEVEVTISNLPDGIEELSFNSVGELNCNEAAYLFYKYNYTTTYNPTALELTTETIGLNITRDISYISDINATLTYNGTNFTLTKTTKGDYISFSTDIGIERLTAPHKDNYFNFTYTIIGNITETNLTITYLQNVSQMLIDNCSTHTTRALNFTIYDDETDGEIVSTLDGYFEIWKETDKTYFNITWSKASKYSLCIDPPSADYNIYAQMQYNNISNGYIKETYYIYNTTLTNVTQLVNLYLTTNTTFITFTVTDENDEKVEGAYIHVARYDFDTNSYIVTEILKTDEAGNTWGNLVLYDTWYKFFIYYDNILKLSTDEPVKITSTSKSFRINLQTDYYEHYNIFKGFVTSLTYTNATSNFVFTFSHPDGISKHACLKVTKRNFTLDTVINESCVTSSSGTILINIGTTPVGLYIADAYIEGSPAFHIILDVNSEEGYKRWGKQGIFMAWLFRLTLALIGIWNPLVAIVLLMAADIFMLLTGIYYMSWSTLMVYIILGLVTMWKVSKK